MKLKNIVDTIQYGVDLLKGEEKVDKTYCSEKTYADGQTAQTAFARAREKLFDVNHWSDLSSITASFAMHDKAGNPKPSGKPEVGDHIKIMLPGPTPENWVQVIDLFDGPEKAGFTARPCADPNEKKAQIEHFFTDDSTSTFTLELLGNTVKACQIGENEIVNNQNPEAGDRAVVNTVIAGTGWLFYQKIQWTTLTDYLVDL